MKQLFACVLMSLLVVWGCGQRLENSFYDTETNPDSLPSMACELLDRIAFGQMASADSVTAGFNELYTHHSELFENEKWRGIITNLGPLFAATADSLATQSLVNYSEAAKYYLLSSLARPSDSPAFEQSRLFDGWSRAIDRMPSATLESDQSLEFEEIMRVTRFLMLGDTVQQRFGSRFVVDRYLDSLVERAKTDLSTFGLADRALLTWLGTSAVGSFEANCSFGDPPVVMVAHQATPWGDDGVMIELYFRSDEITSGFDAIIPDLGVEGTDIVLPLRGPSGTSDLWLANGLIPVMRPFQDLSLGLRDSSDVYLTLSGTNDEWFAAIKLGGDTSVR